MAPYVIAEIDNTERAGSEGDRQVVPTTMAHYGGRYLVRVHGTEALAGD